MYYVLKYLCFALAHPVLAGVVVHGAAIHAASFYSSDVQDVFQVELSPWTLGVTVCAGDTANVIPKQAPLDVEYSTIISTMATLSIGIYEGSPAGDIVGCIELTGIAPAPMYVPEIEVTFKFHENWELHVSAVDKTSKNSSSIVIDMRDRLPESSSSSFISGTFVKCRSGLTVVDPNMLAAEG